MRTFAKKASLAYAGELSSKLYGPIYSTFMQPERCKCTPFVSDKKGANSTISKVEDPNDSEALSALRIC